MASDRVDTARLREVAWEVGRTDMILGTAVIDAADELDALRERCAAMEGERGRLAAMIDRLLRAGCTTEPLPEYYQNPEWKPAFDAAVNLLNELRLLAADAGNEAKGEDND